MAKKRVASKSTGDHSSSAKPKSATKPSRSKKVSPDWDEKVRFPVSKPSKALHRHFTKDELKIVSVPYTCNLGNDPRESASEDIATLYRFISQHKSVNPIELYSNTAAKTPSIYYQEAVAYLFDKLQSAFPFDSFDRTELRLIAGRLSHTHPRSLNPNVTVKNAVERPGKVALTQAASQLLLGTNYSSQPKMNNVFQRKNTPLTTSMPPTTAPAQLPRIDTTSAPPLVPTAIHTSEPSPAAAPSLATAATPPENHAPLPINTDFSTPKGRPPDANHLSAATQVTPATATAFTLVTARKPPKITEASTTTARPTRKYSIRVRYKLNLSKQNKDAPKILSKLLRSHITSIFTNLMAQDKTVILLPWALASKANCITSPSDLPDINSAAWKTYVYNQSTLSADKECWLQLCWAYDTGPDDIFTSYGVSKEWFEEHKHGAYLCAVHDSDDEIDIGYFRWSGDFIDVNRLTVEFHNFMEINQAKKYHQPYTKLRIAFRIKSHRFLEMGTRKDDRKPNFPGYEKLAPDKAIAVHCHKPDAQTCKTALKMAFNQANKHFTQRPGGYDISYVPSANISQSGHNPTEIVKATDNRGNMTLSHQSVITSLQYFDVDCIRSLDTPIRIDTAPDIPMPLYLWSPTGKPLSFPCRLTLRQVLMGVAHPLPGGPPPGFLNPDGGLHLTKTNDRLFQSVDRVLKSFSNKDSTVFRCTSLTTRNSLARAFMSALPSWILTFFKASAFNAWIKGNIADMDDESFDFGRDEHGIWDGSWTSADENDMESDLLNMPSACPWNMIADLALLQPPAGTNLFTRPTAVADHQPQDHATADDLTVAIADVNGPKNAFKNIQDEDSLTIRKDDDTAASEAPTAQGDHSSSDDDGSETHSDGTNDSHNAEEQYDSAASAPSADEDCSLLGKMKGNTMEEDDSSTDTAMASTKRKRPQLPPIEASPAQHNPYESLEHGLDSPMAEEVPPDPPDEASEQHNINASQVPLPDSPVRDLTMFDRPPSPVLSTPQSVKSTDKTPKKKTQGVNLKAHLKQDDRPARVVTRQSSASGQRPGTAPSGASARSNAV